jgi:very-short-patch-repair endonuclease
MPDSMDEHASSPIDPVVAKLHASRKELLDLSLRNPLLNYRGSARRGVEILATGTPAVFEALVEQRKSLRFHATKPEPRPLAADEDDDGKPRRRGRPAKSRLEPLEAEPSAPASARGPLHLATPYAPSVLEARLLATYYDAWLGQEERGCNTLYLALGMLRWREDAAAEEDRFAPLVLVPVSLDRSSARSGWSMVHTDEDPGPNISLAEKMREFGVQAPPAPEWETGQDLAGYLEAWRAAISGQPAWSIEADRIGVAFFNFARFLMWRDLDPAQWPADHQPGAHPLLRSLFQDGFRDAPGEEHAGDLDARRPAGEAMEILDSDSSQATAIDRVARGGNLVIHGPPGTGKSQTIANLIADAVARGQRVLFVAEKLAALEVVKRRLDQCGVGELCLEIHSDKANKKAVVENLRATLTLGRPLPAKEEQAVAGLKDYRQRLNGYAVAAAAPVPPTDHSPFSAIGHQERLRDRLADLPGLPIEPMAALTPETYRRAREAVAGFARIIGEIGLPTGHAFHECQLAQCLPGDEDRVAREADAAGAALAEAAAAAARLAAALGVSAPTTIAAASVLAALAGLAREAPEVSGLPAVGAGWDDAGTRHAVEAALSAGERRAGGRATWAATLLEAAWTTDVRAARADIALDGGSWWRRLFSGRYRAARRLLAAVSTLPPLRDPQRMLAACDAILADQAAQAVLDQHHHAMTTLFGPRWQGPASAWAELRTIAAWCQRWRAAIAKHPQAAILAQWVVGAWERPAVATQAAEVERTAAAATTAWTGLGRRLGHAVADGATCQRATLDTLAGSARRWAAGKAALAGWADYCRASTALRTAGFTDLAMHAHTGKLPPDRLVPAFERAWAALASTRAFAERPELAGFTAAGHTELVARFQEADPAVFAANRARLALRHWDRLPSTVGFGQVGILRRECAKKARHLAIRQLMHQAGNAVQAFKPVFMMSPLSVATFLPPGGVSFDVVIFDEASQVRPVDALGAILRGRQLVVVGDEQQMPPTSFFDKLMGEEADPDEEVSETADMQSVLGLCLGRGMRSEMLRWHYRSRHDSLIALSNQEFYRGELVVFPSARRGIDGEGLRLDHHPGTVYERGGTRTNPLEAEAVVAAVVEHIRLRPTQSLGVVAFSAAQANAISDRIERLRKDDPAAEAALKALRPDEPFFVKNLENVQGDERDAIYISVGYGRDRERNLTMNFGPLGHHGGERRLNVLITRARVCCRVFTNLTHEDIDLRRAGGKGVQVFKQFLQFAATGSMQMAISTGAGHDSMFEQEVAGELRRRGFDIEPQVGCSGYRIDLAVVDPQARGTYLLGIECDGAMYHSSRWARDRDRLRETVLRSLGWRLHRIWSTDWFRRRDDAIRRVLEAIAAARTAGPPAGRPHAAPGVERDSGQPAARPSRIVPYQVAKLHANLGDRHLADLDSAALGRALAKVVEVESPMHIEDLRRRVLDAIEGRSGSRRLAAIDAGIDAAAGTGLLRREGDFLWMNGHREVVPRDRSELAEAARAPHLVAESEYRAAVRAVVEEGCGCNDHEEAGAQAILALGIKRNDEAVELAGEAVRAMVSEGLLARVDDGRIERRSAPT